MKLVDNLEKMSDKDLRLANRFYSLFNYYLHKLDIKAVAKVGFWGGMNCYFYGVLDMDAKQCRELSIEQAFAIIKVSAEQRPL